MVACSQESLTIEQQNSILNLCKNEKNENKNNIVNKESDAESDSSKNGILKVNGKSNNGNKSKSLAKLTFSKALAALESLEYNQLITFKLVNFICDNIDFDNSSLGDNNGPEIDNFYGIVYRFVTHNNTVIRLLNMNNQHAIIVKNTLESICKLAVDGIESVFSETFSESQNQEAPYMIFWQKIKETKKGFLELLSSETIEYKIKQNDNVYVKKLNDLLNKLKVRIKIEEDKISLETVENPEIDNLNTINDNQVEKKKEANTNKSKLPKLAKILIGLLILAVAVLALLFGFGVIGSLAGAAKAVAFIVAVVAIFAELVY